MNLYRPEPEQELGAPQDEEVPVDNTCLTVIINIINIINFIIVIIIITIIPEDEVSVDNTCASRTIWVRSTRFEFECTIVKIMIKRTWREEVEAPKLTAPPLRALPPPRRVLTSDLESCRAACQRGISFDNKIEEYRNKDYHLGSQQTGTTHPCKHLRSRLTLEPDAKYSDGRQHSDCRWWGRCKPCMIECSCSAPRRRKLARGKPGILVMLINVIIFLVIVIKVQRPFLQWCLWRQILPGHVSNGTLSASQRQINASRAVSSSYKCARLGAPE